MAAGCHADNFVDFCMPWVCATQEAKLCGAAKRQGRSECSACLQTHSAALMKADCHADDFADFCAEAPPDNWFHRNQCWLLLKIRTRLRRLLRLHRLWLLLPL